MGASSWSSYKPFRKIYIAAVLFTSAVVAGTLGYVSIEHYTWFEALYMTIITLSTVGYGEVHPLSMAGKTFTMFLIVFDLGIFAYVVALISSYFLEGEFSEEYKLFKMKKSITGLTGHVIICGFGRNGQEAARTLSDSGKAFVAIEKMMARQGELPFMVDYFLESDATKDEVLKQAGIENAAALITTLPEDADNLFVVLTARELNPGLKIISRASQDTSVKKLKIAGANNVIMPDKVGGSQMASMVISPDIKEFIDLLGTQAAGFGISEIECIRSFWLDEVNSWHKTGVTILGIKSGDGDYNVNPAPRTQVSAGQRLIVMGSASQIESLKKLI